MSGKLLRHSTVILALIALVSSSLYDTLVDREYLRMRERNKILHDKLINEKCPDAEGMIGKRGLLGYPKDKLRLEIEEELHENLLEMLIKCRENKGTTMTPPAPVSTTILQKTTVQTTTASPTTLKPPTTAQTTTTLYSTTTTTAPQPVECLNAINLTESWRSDNNGGKLASNCDTEDMKKNGRPWFRFTGPAGNQLLNTCPPPSSCGTAAGIWSAAAMPTKIGAVTSITAYASWSNKGCKEFLESVSVVRCSDSIADFVYKYNSYSYSCNHGFCGMFAQ